jgi:S-ribosylhomocysteine lyase LuxS involved in autoinducer biosynthesis
MPHYVKLHPNGERKAHKCKIPKWVEGVNDDTVLNFDIYGCKPFVFLAKDYLNETELETLKHKYANFIPDDMPF